MKKLEKREGGFTIIEVVLVLAIAGLIFLIVFLAVPALQRSQRDTQRKSDLGRFMAQVNSYQSNNKGAVPTADAAGITGASGLVPNYLTVASDTWEDPSTGPYSYDYGLGSPTALGKIRYAVSATCGTNGAIVTASGTRKVAASIFLENGPAYCQNN